MYYVLVNFTDFAEVIEITECRYHQVLQHSVHVLKLPLVFMCW